MTHHPIGPALLEHAAFQLYLDADDFETRGVWLAARKAVRRMEARRAREQARSRELMQLADLARRRARYAQRRAA